MSMINDQTKDQDDLPKGRFVLGVSIFVFAFCMPLLIPLVVASSLPSGWKVTLSGLLALGIPDVLMVLAAVVLGKSGFDYLKKRTFELLKHYTLPITVSLARYRSV